MVIHPWSDSSFLLCSLHQNKSVCSPELSRDVEGPFVIPHINSLNTWRWKVILLSCANALLKTTVSTAAAHDRMCCHRLHDSYCYHFYLTFTRHYLPSSITPCMDGFSPYWLLLSPYAGRERSSGRDLHFSQSGMRHVKVGWQTDDQRCVVYRGVEVYPYMCLQLLLLHEYLLCSTV